MADTGNRMSSASRRSSVASICVLAAVLLVGCQPSRLPNVVLITVDTLRADHLSPYGYDKIETSAIAKLASEGIVFEKAFADTPWTLPSVSSVMTGRYPTEHRVRTWHHSLGEEQETIAEILSGRGYTTAAIVGSYPLDRFFGLAQGFEHYDDEMTTPLYESKGSKPALPGTVLGRPLDDTMSARSRWQMSRELNDGYRTDAEVADRAIAWLAQHPERPFFLWVHFFGPHEKGKRSGLSPAEQKAHKREQIARYDPDIERMDEQVGRLLAALRADPRGAETAVVFHSDHGQALDEHGVFGHGMELYDTTVHVPLIVRLPSQERAGERVAHLVRNLDIFATILHLAGIPAGESDSQDLLTSQPATGNHVYLETHHTVGLFAQVVEVGNRRRKIGRILRGIRTDQSKLIEQLPILAPGESSREPLPQDYVSKQTRVRLFDLRTDPREKRNVAQREEGRAAELVRYLGVHDDQSDTAEGSRHELDEATRERLRSLGYEP